MSITSNSQAYVFSRILIILASQSNMPAKIAFLDKKFSRLRREKNL
jgi:amino acid permease